ncbi:MAG: hypothetical protein LBC84_04285 [Prevotellaceae bacterium]|jgi:hypothetical protein|nr:hypothetical protein [Prevotellaceae bacterium]
MQRKRKSMNISTNYGNAYTANTSNNASLPAGMKPLTGEFFEEFLRNRREVMESLGYGDQLNTGLRLLKVDGASVTSPFHDFRMQFASLARVSTQEAIDNRNNIETEHHEPWLDFPMTDHLHPWMLFGHMSPSAEGASSRALWLQRSILEYPGLAEMSDIEAYNFIEAQFLAVFGNDFMDGFNLKLGDLTDTFGVGMHFRVTLQSHFGHSFTANAVNRERLFGDKSDAEIRQIIMDRYPRNMTNRELAMMHGEMLAVGLFDSPPDWVPPNKGGMCSGTMIRSYSRDFGSNWADMLDKPVNWNKLFNGQNYWMQSGRHVFSPESIDFLSAITTNFANKSGQGNFDWFLRSLDQNAILGRN